LFYSYGAAQGTPYSPVSNTLSTTAQGVQCFRQGP